MSDGFGMISEVLSSVGFDDPGGAGRILLDLAGHDIGDDRFELLSRQLMAGLAATGDPDRALVNFARWLSGVGNRSSYFSLLTNHPAALQALLSMFAASQFFSDLLIRNPEHFEAVINPLIRDRERGAVELARDAALRVGIAKTLAGKRDALRRFKPPEILRIGARDILGIAATSQVIAEISDFADACVQTALEIAGSPVGFAAIALGKLGGRELNYASDIDLMYVHADNIAQSEAVSIAESVTLTLSAPTGAGFLFRVDLRLRPEGRFGPISRSLSSCRAYYESWAEPWERQALLKARPVAGDSNVGAEFSRIVEPFVYRRTVDQEFVEAIRENKRAIERKVARDGETDCNIKEGKGGIRDVEFIVQLLQLVHGGAAPSLRAPSTLDGLRALAAEGLIAADDADQLASCYLFLRDIEHRLQIMDERPIRNLPTRDAGALDKFARRLGYPSSNAFLDACARHTSRASECLERLFYGAVDPARAPKSDPVDDLISDWIRDPAQEERRAAVVPVLTDMGFAEPLEVARAIERQVSDSDYGEPDPRTGERMAALAPRLLRACADSGYPDDALKGIDLLASASPSTPAFLLGLIENPELMRRLAILAGAAPTLWRALIEHPELLDRLADDELLERPSAVSPESANTPPSDRQTAAFVRRERLRIAALDLWGLADAEEVMRQTTATAEKALLAAFEAALFERGHGGPIDPSAPVPALIGLGKLGGRELSYASDWDVLWIAPGEADDAAPEARLIAERTMDFLNTRVKAHDLNIEVDARLRPEGRFGTLARTISDYARYFETGADAWERQVLIKARPIGGDPDIGARFLAEANRIVYDAPPDDVEVAQIRHLKSRMERERAKSPSDIKLGPGGLSDIEWTVQLLQWRFGKRWPQARTPNTAQALLALRDAAVIRQDDWEILSSAYNRLYTARNRAWLRNEHARDTRSAIQDESLIEQRKLVREVFERLFLERNPS
jgi:glutamate-ammonia-ligase adenylyltransferase